MNAYLLGFIFFRENLNIHNPARLNLQHEILLEAISCTFTFSVDLSIYFKFIIDIQAAKPFSLFCYRILSSPVPQYPGKEKIIQNPHASGH